MGNFLTQELRWKSDEIGGRWILEDSSINDEALYKVYVILLDAFHETTVLCRKNLLVGSSNGYESHSSAVLMDTILKKPIRFVSELQLKNIFGPAGSEERSVNVSIQKEGSTEPMIQAVFQHVKNLAESHAATAPTESASPLSLESNRSFSFSSTRRTHAQQLVYQRVTHAKTFYAKFALSEEGCCFFSKDLCLPTKGGGYPQSPDQFGYSLWDRRKENIHHAACWSLRHLFIHLAFVLGYATDEMLHNGESKYREVIEEGGVAIEIPSKVKVKSLFHDYLGKDDIFCFFDGGYRFVHGTTPEKHEDFRKVLAVELRHILEGIAGGDHDIPPRVALGQFLKTFGCIPPFAQLEGKSLLEEASSLLLEELAICLKPPAALQKSEISLLSSTPNSPDKKVESIDGDSPIPGEDDEDVEGQSNLVRVQFSEKTGAVAEEPSDLYKAPVKRWVSCDAEGLQDEGWEGYTPEEISYHMRSHISAEFLGQNIPKVAAKNIETNVADPVRNASSALMAHGSSVAPSSLSVGSLQQPNWMSFSLLASKGTIDGLLEGLPQTEKLLQIHLSIPSGEALTRLTFAFALHELDILLFSKLAEDAQQSSNVQLRRLDVEREVFELQRASHYRNHHYALRSISWVNEYDAAAGRHCPPWEEKLGVFGQLTVFLHRSPDEEDGSPNVVHIEATTEGYFLLLPYHQLQPVSDIHQLISKDFCRGEKFFSLYSLLRKSSKHFQSFRAAELDQLLQRDGNKVPYEKLSPGLQRALLEEENIAAKKKREQKVEASKAENVLALEEKAEVPAIEKKSVQVARFQLDASAETSTKDHSLHKTAPRRRPPQAASVPIVKGMSRVAASVKNASHVSTAMIPHKPSPMIHSSLGGVPDEVEDVVEIQLIWSDAEIQEMLQMEGALCTSLWLRLCSQPTAGDFTLVPPELQILVALGYDCDVTALEQEEVYTQSKQSRQQIHFMRDIVGYDRHHCSMDLLRHGVSVTEQFQRYIHLLLSTNVEGKLLYAMQSIKKCNVVHQLQHHLEFDISLLCLHFVHRLVKLYQSSQNYKVQILSAQLLFLVLSVQPFASYVLDLVDVEKFVFPTVKRIHDAVNYLKHCESVASSTGEEPKAQAGLDSIFGSLTSLLEQRLTSSSSNQGPLITSQIFPNPRDAKITLGTFFVLIAATCVTDPTGKVRSLWLQERGILNNITFLLKKLFDTQNDGILLATLSCLRILVEETSFIRKIPQNFWNNLVISIGSQLEGNPLFVEPIQTSKNAALVNLLALVGLLCTKSLAIRQLFQQLPVVINSVSSLIVRMTKKDYSRYGKQLFLGSCMVLSLLQGTPAATRKIFLLLFETGQANWKQLVPPVYAVSSVTLPLYVSVQNRRDPTILCMLSAFLRIVTQAPIEMKKFSPAICNVALGLAVQLCEHVVQSTEAEMASNGSEADGRGSPDDRLSVKSPSVSSHAEMIPGSFIHFNNQHYSLLVDAWIVIMKCLDRRLTYPLPFVEEQGSPLPRSDSLRSSFADSPSPRFSVCSLDLSSTVGRMGIVVDVSGAFQPVLHSLLEQLDDMIEFIISAISSSLTLLRLAHREGGAAFNLDDLYQSVHRSHLYLALSIAAEQCDDIQEEQRQRIQQAVASMWEFLHVLVDAKQDGHNEPLLLSETLFALQWVALQAPKLVYGATGNVPNCVDRLMEMYVRELEDVQAALEDTRPRVTAPSITLLVPMTYLVSGVLRHSNVLQHESNTVDDSDEIHDITRKIFALFGWIGTNTENATGSDFHQRRLSVYNNPSHMRTIVRLCNTKDVRRLLVSVVHWCTSALIYLQNFPDGGADVLNRGLESRNMTREVILMLNNVLLDESMSSSPEVPMASSPSLGEVPSFQHVIRSGENEEREVIYAFSVELLWMQTMLDEQATYNQVKAPVDGLQLVSNMFVRLTSHQVKVHCRALLKKWFAIAKRQRKMSVMSNSGSFRVLKGNASSSK